MKGTTLALLAATALLLSAACGGGGEDDGPVASETVSPTADAEQRNPIGPSGLCQLSQDPLPAYNVQLSARWEGDDRIVIEGSADLPGPGSVNYWICQDGQLTAALRWARQPTFEGGEIRAESELVEASAGPIFDPEAHFDVVLSILGEPVQVPYFTIAVPVEGKPD